MRNIRHYPLHSFYQVDGVKLVTMGERSYLIGASEGDIREYTVEDHGLSSDWNEAYRGRDSEFQGKVSEVFVIVC